MARRGTREFEAIMRDDLSDTEIVFYYNRPTTQDDLRFENNFQKRKGGSIEADVVEEQIDLGLEKITGIRDGDFERVNESGEWVPVSSDPKSEHYFEDWKGFLREFADDLVARFTLHVFRRGTSPVKSSARVFDAGK